MIRLTYPDNHKDPSFQPMVEQTEYLRGVLYADKEHRLDSDLTRDIGSEIDPYGTGSKHFWRGVIESAGYVQIESAGRYDYPQFELKGGYNFLKKFLAFLEEEFAPCAPVPGVKFDFDGKLDWQARGGFVKLRGLRVQELVKALYLGASVSRASFRGKADRIVQWLPKR